jgi:hypothetical protein
METNDEAKVPLTIHSYELVKNQQFMIEAAREYLKDTEPWNTDVEEVKDDYCIRLEDFHKWRNRLLKILGARLDE